MRKLPFTLLISFVILHNVYSQSVQYQGFVFDSETKKPIEFASVSVLGKDSSIVAGTVTDENCKIQVIQNPRIESVKHYYSLVKI